MTRTPDERDRRSFFATLTRPGNRRLRESRPTHNDVVRTHLTQRLTAAQLATFGTLLDKLIDE